MILLFGILVAVSCLQPKSSSLHQQLLGSWQLFYGEIKENDSIIIKDVSKSTFIKIINKTHFAFFNQEHNTNVNFYGGAGTYTLDKHHYTETLSYIESTSFRNHKFEFEIEIKGDTLIQKGLEEIPESGIKRYIVEKYIRIPNPSLP